MSELDSDPLQISPTALSEAERINPIDESLQQTPQTFWVDPPMLDAEAKSKYKTIPEEFIASGVEFDAPNVDQIIGEYRDENGLYYYARFQTGIAYKVTIPRVLRIHACV